MIATLDDGGWETVANVQFQAVPNKVTEEDKGSAPVPPPPEFSINDDKEQNETNILHEDTSRPSRQYVYGEEEEEKDRTVKVVEISKIKGTHTHENVIEAEIREQKIREETIRLQKTVDETLKGDRVSSPSSHTSDEGFVDRPNEDVMEGYTRAVPKSGEAVVYTSKACAEDPTNVVTSEAKIALEIRELREREAELRVMRDIQKKQVLLAQPEEEYEGSSSSSREAIDDHLASLTTTTDEGNFSECGDQISSEDKSSDGSNSRIMSPDLIPYSSAELRQRRVTVKPYEDDDVEEQPPVYTRMKKESVIEREIRMSKEREDAYRREKGLLTDDNSAKESPVVKKVTSSKSKSATVPINSKKLGRTLTSTIIQQELEEDLRKERELKLSGHIKTLSEDTVEPKDSAVKNKFTDSINKDGSPLTPLAINTARSGFSHQQQKSPPSPNYQFTPSPPNRPPAQNRLIRSFSTTNLSAPFPGSLSNGLRPPKGLMQKFIASKGKITAQTFATSMQPVAKPNGTIYTRSTSLKPKMSVARSEAEKKMESGKSISRIYKRKQLTAEEKIQEELREMKKREEELKRLRGKTFGPSQSHLADAGMEAYDDNDDTDSCTLPEINNLRTALSNPNLLDCDQPIVTSLDKQARRKSVLIAQWEDRIQQTNES